MKSSLILFFLLSTGSAGFCQGPTIIGDSKTQTDDDLDENALKDFNEHAKQKVEMFQNYLTIVADKTQPLEKRLAAQRQAEDLFIKGKDIYIEVSSKNSAKKTKYSVMDYLERVFNAQGYTQVKITFYDTCLISDWKKVGNGKYESVATIYQQFEGYFQGKLKYSDRTSKTVELDLDKMRDTNYDSSARATVLLGNITVEHTTAVKAN